MLGFTAELPGVRGILASSVLGEQLSGSRSVQDGCTPCQCISGLAAHGGGRSRFMKNAGRSQLPLAKSHLDHASGSAAWDRAELPPRGVRADGRREPSARARPILGRSFDTSRGWM